MDFPNLLDLCLHTGIEFLRTEPLALLLEDPIRLVLQTACLRSSQEVELEIAYRKLYGSEFIHLHAEHGCLIARQGEPTNNIFSANTKETCDIRVTANGSHYGFAFELKCTGNFGTNRNFNYRKWAKKDLLRLFTVGLSMRGETTDSMIEGALLAATRQRYDALRKEAPYLLVEFEKLPNDASLKSFPAKFRGEDCWLRGGRCTSWGEERAMVCVTRIGYLDEPWPDE